MDELFASVIRLAMPPEYNVIFENGDETESSKVQRNHLNCPSLEVCVDWTKLKKNASFLLLDKFSEENYASGVDVGENSGSFCAYFIATANQF